MIIMSIMQQLSIHQTLRNYRLQQLKQWEPKLTPLPVNSTPSSLDYELLYNTVDPIQIVILQNASFVLCDCLQAVNFVTEGSEYWKKREWLKKLLSLQEELLDINVSVYLAWIPGHVGICANETADELAKQMAQDIVRRRIAPPSHISMQSALQLSSEIAYNFWQQKWERDSFGFYTRLVLPQVRTKVTFPNDRDTGVSYCRMLLNDTLLNEDRFKNGLRESPMSDCNKERETVSHFLLRCPHYEEIMNKLQNVVDNIWTSAKRKGHLQLSDNLLLAPTQTDCTTKRMDRDIKFAFFFNSSDQLIERFDPLLLSS